MTYHITEDMRWDGEYGTEQVNLLHPAPLAAPEEPSTSTLPLIVASDLCLIQGSTHSPFDKHRSSPSALVSRRDYLGIWQLSVGAIVFLH